MNKTELIDQIATSAEISKAAAGRALDATVAAVKAYATDMQCKVADNLLQLFGGYGYMTEYPISRFYVDARIQRIYGGTNEIMKDIVARDLLGR